MEREAPILLRDLAYAYQGSGDALAVDGVDLAIAAGEVVGVLGPNGSGKSTIAKLVSGLMAPSRGSARVLGEEASAITRSRMATRLAVVPQRDEIAFGFTVGEVVLMGRAPHLGLFGIDRREDREIAEEALVRADAWALRDRPFAGLSGGEQKRVSIARALAQRAPALILDEATAMLDIHHQIALLDLVVEEVRVRKVATLMVLHDLNLASQYCDRLLLMRGGKPVAVGSIEEVLTYRRVHDTFGVDVYVGVNELNGARIFIPMRGRTQSS